MPCFLFSRRFSICTRSRGVPCPLPPQPPSDDLHTSKGRRCHIHTQRDTDAAESRYQEFVADAAESRYQEFVRRAITRDSEKKRQSVSQSVTDHRVYYVDYICRLQEPSSSVAKRTGVPYLSRASLFRDLNLSPQ